ncbi:phage tail protein [Erwinia aphidicola]|jgi:hypothetical protein|uniref:phage tail protein n=1 Tax=Erwinia TaxID=551 RepID=UPI00105FDC78|nr:phage-related tail protein [Klebsiella pneumoniae]
MMMILGMFVFQRRTLPFQTMTHQSAYRWAAGSRIGSRPAQQFLGVGDESITLAGELRPEITGGVPSLAILKGMAESGRVWPLLSGEGIPYGIFVIEAVNGVHTDLLANGAAQKISFTLQLKRVDGSLDGLYGDLKQQLEQIYGEVSSKARELAGSLL